MRLRWALTLLWALAATVGVIFWNEQARRSAREAEHQSWVHQISTIHTIQFAHSELGHLLSEKGRPEDVVGVYNRLTSLSTLLLEQETLDSSDEWNSTFYAITEGNRTLGSLLQERPLSEVRNELLQHHRDRFTRLSRLMEALQEVYQAKNFKAYDSETSLELRRAGAMAKEYLEYYPWN